MVSNRHNRNKNKDLNFRKIFAYSEYLDPLQRLDPLTKVGPVNCIIEEVATVFGHNLCFHIQIGLQDAAATQASSHSTVHLIASKARKICCDLDDAVDRSNLCQRVQPMSTVPTFAMGANIKECVDQLN